MSPEKIIQDPQTPPDSLIKALQALGSDSPGAEFWNGVANDAAFTSLHRKHAVIQLFHRHVHAPQPLPEFVELVGKHAWNRESTLEPILILGGKIPIKWEMDQSAFKWQILKDGPGEIAHVYFSIFPEIEPAALQSWLDKGEVPDSASAYKVMEVGFAGDLLAGYNKPW